MAILNEIFDDYLLPDTETMNEFFKNDSLEKEIDEFHHKTINAKEQYDWHHAFAEVM